MFLGRFGKGNGDFYVAEARKDPDGVVRVHTVETSSSYEYLAVKYGFMSADSEDDSQGIFDDIYPEE